LNQLHLFLKENLFAVVKGIAKWTSQIRVELLEHHVFLFLLVHNIFTLIFFAAHPHM